MRLLATLAIVIITMASGMAFADGHGHPILTPLEPKSMDRAYTDFVMSDSEFIKKSGFDSKTHQLIALAAAAGMKCEYCILAHTGMAKKAGATDEEIKTTVMIAGKVAINSTILYGNQYNIDTLRKMFAK